MPPPMIQESGYWPRRALIYITSTCSLILLGFCGGSMWTITEDGKFPVYYDRQLHQHDKKFLIFWCLPVALSLLATAILDSSSTNFFRPVERSHTPARSLTTCDRHPSLWAKHPWLSSLYVVALLITLNLLQGLGFYHGKMKATPPPVPTEDKLEFIYRAIAVAASWNVALALVLYARNQVLGRYYGVGFAKGILWHKYLGGLALCQYTLHGIMAVVVYYRYGKDDLIGWRNVHNKLSPIESNRGFDNFFGLLSWGAMVVMFLGALEPVRRRRFVAFAWSHQLWVLAIIWGMFHIKCNAYMWAAPIVYIIHDKLHLKLLRLYTADEGYITTASDSIVRIEIPAKLSSIDIPAGLPAYKPGDNIYLTVPLISHFHRHPFTIASFYPEDPDRIVLYAKVVGPWTKALWDLASNVHDRKPIPLVIDGYWGGHELAYYLHYNRVVFVAGGTGITAIIGILKHYMTVTKGNATLIWSVSSAAHLEAFGWFLAQLQKDPLLHRVRVSIFITGGDLPNKITTVPHVHQPPSFELDSVVKDEGEVESGGTVSKTSTTPANTISTERSFSYLQEVLALTSSPAVILAFLSGLSLVLGLVIFRATLLPEFINKEQCDKTAYLHVERYVPCKLWFSAGPLLVPVIFALVLGQGFLWLYPKVQAWASRDATGRKKVDAAPSSPSPTSYVTTDLASILSDRVICHKGRADFNAVLRDINTSNLKADEKNGQKQLVAFIVAGPEAVANKLKEAAKPYASLVHLYQESVQL